MTRRHIVLVGLPGSGKTTVGRLVAAELGAAFVDLDEAVERHAGKSVPRLFAEDGESAFRRHEAEVGGAVLAGAPAVVAAGGGFLEAEGTRAVAGQSGLVIYLETDPLEAARRLGGPAGRPLLEVGDTAARIASLLATREARYGAAECTVRTTGLGAAEVARLVASLARDRAGW